MIEYNQNFIGSLERSTKGWRLERVLNVSPVSKEATPIRKKTIPPSSKNRRSPVMTVSCKPPALQASEGNCPPFERSLQGSKRGHSGQQPCTEALPRKKAGFNLKFCA